MAVKIRLARGGAKKKPYYRVVVANATAPRDGDFLEKVGTYNPLLAKGEGEKVTLKADRISYWLSQGAEPTEKVAKFIAEAGIELPKFVKNKMAVQEKVRAAKAVQHAADKAAKEAEKAKELAEAEAVAKEEAKAKAEEEAAAQAAAAAAEAEAKAAEAEVVADAPADEAPAAAEEAQVEEASTEEAEEKSE